MFKVFQSQPKPALVILPFRNFSFVTPTQDEPSDYQYTLEGSVTISLPKPARVQELIVEFRCIATLMFPGNVLSPARRDIQLMAAIDQRYEEVLLEHLVEIKSVRGKLLGPGDHEFTFGFPIPSTAAPYERCSFGQVNQELKAQSTVEDFGVITAEWLQPIFMTWPTPRHAILPSLDIRKADFSPHLGVWQAHVVSPLLTPASLIRVSFSLEDVPSPVRIYSIQAFFLQQYHLKSTLEEFREYTPPHTKIMLFNTKLGPQAHEKLTLEPASSGHLADVDSGASFKMTFDGRAARDTVLRPTTLPYTITPIRISHRLSIEIKYGSEDSSTRVAKVMEVQFPVNIATCVIHMKDGGLPSYEHKDSLGEYFADGKEKRARILAAAYRNCICWMSREELLALSQGWDRPQLTEGESGTASKEDNSELP